MPSTPLVLYFLDINMPDVDGYAVCRHLKADPIHDSIPVVFVTAMAEMGNEKEGFAAGCVDYLIKPIYPDIVLARVKMHLSLVRAVRLEQSYRDAVFMLGEAGHFNDNDTSEHIWRMAAYSRALAKNVGGGTSISVNCWNWPLPCMIWAKLVCRMPFCANPAS